MREHGNFIMESRDHWSRTAANGGGFAAEHEKAFVI